ncbi:GNAT family N-acetyltransferase [Paenibacillus lautus]|jgi:GNAT superfamily N-acetyltransferase|uniref:GNAT family N-acetyltransferase n=1 Tax=Paenibacillus lautus TaxID=1401 RepID=UPI001FEB5497|nr:GNAT family N-acetyltransferase [Paenibacillus lautus]
MNNMIVHEVADLGAVDITELLTESKEEGFRNIHRLVNEYNEGMNTFQHEDEALFECRVGHRVIGICGLNRDPYSGGSIGRIRRLYVLKEFRRLGAGRRLVEAVIHKASSHYTKLVLKTDNPKAAEFYKNLGFKGIADDELVTHELDL